jgi:hypothetical protein
MFKQSNHEPRVTNHDLINPLAQINQLPATIDKLRTQFMQNKPNLQVSQMNVSYVKTKSYEL